MISHLFVRSAICTCMHILTVDKQMDTHVYTNICICKKNVYIYMYTHTHIRSYITSGTAREGAFGAKPSDFGGAAEAEI